MASIPGPAVDASGNQVVDPTRNVLDLVTAAIRRQDDLRAADTRLAQVREQYAAELRRAEAARIDAIRAVDVGAVNRAAEVSATQATTLAAQARTSEETLRTQVTATAAAAASALSAELEPIRVAISDLRRVQYEAAGVRANVTDTREAGGNRGMWIGLAISAAALVSTFVLASAGIVVTLLLR